MGGLTFARALELCACLDRQAVALQDNDGRTPEELRASVAHLLAPDKRVLCVSDPAKGRTLEPQLLSVNHADRLRRILGVTDAADVNKWMQNNKTEGALRIFDADDRVTYPDYFVAAVELLR